MGRVVVVDQDDVKVGLKAYADLRYGDMYRVTALWLTDTKTGDILITQRKWSKHHDPGKWMSAVSGTVEDDETYDENIAHETEEEIGLTGLHFRTGPKECIDDGKHKYFVQWYYAETDKTATAIIIQEDEVEAFAWISKNNLLEGLADYPNKYVPSFRNSLTTLGVVTD